MIAAPLLVGVLAVGPAWIHLPLAAFWFVGYFAFFATSLWLKARRRPNWWPPVRAYGLASIALAVVVVILRPGLVAWAPWFVLPLGVGLWAAAARRDRDLSAGVATVAGASLMTVVAYAAAMPGRIEPVAWWWPQIPERPLLLALVQFLYFAGTVFYVKSVIRERGNQRFLMASLAFHAVAAAVAWWLAWPLGLVFVALLVRAALIPRLGWTPKQVGLLEIPATVLVSVLSLVLL